ncbi:MAG: hypothetical protein IJY69_05045 [Clostridia bacterium]|nr:hypothetical protein [Clostridia bacterium]
MVVEYKRANNKNFGTAFVLVENGKELEKRLVVGNGFIPTEPQNWLTEWNEAGVSAEVLDKLPKYEEKTKKIMNSSSRNSEIVG